MEEKNLLDDMRIPMKEIVAKVNWCLVKAMELEKKYTIQDRRFSKLNSRSFFGLYGSVDYGIKFDIVLEVVNYYDEKIKITGITSTFDKYLYSNIRSTCYAPKGLFENSTDELIDEMEKCYRDEFNKRKAEELEHWNDVIKEANEMILLTQKIQSA